MFREVTHGPAVFGAVERAFRDEGSPLEEFLGALYAAAVLEDGLARGFWFGLRLGFLRLRLDVVRIHRGERARDDEAERRCEQDPRGSAPLQIRPRRRCQAWGGGDHGRTLHEKPPAR